MTRINEFFYVDEQTADRFGIETAYLWPLIKSPKDTNTIAIDTMELQLRVFVCRETKEHLRKLRHIGALRYIEWGEQQRWLDGTAWKDGTWVRDREIGWWALPESETHLSQVFFSKGADERHIQRYSPSKLVADQRLYYLSPKARINTGLLSACLNATLTAFCIELSVPLTGGDGICELRVEDARDYLFVPDAREFGRKQATSILRAFEQLLNRPVASVFDEAKQLDRRAVDSAILDAIGLDPKKYLKPLYDGLCELVRERVELGKMRGKERKTRARSTRAEKQVAEAVLDEVVPEGPKRFPDEFFSPAAAGANRISIPLPQADLRFDNLPMNMEVHTTDNTFNRKVKNQAEAKFLMYAQRAGQKTAELPEQPVEVTRTVANYEKYLRELRKELYEAYYRRTLDHAASARLTQAAFDRFRLPTIANS